jgi:hypothetical protein
MKFKYAVLDAVKTLASDAFIKRIKEEDDTMLKHLTILKEINKYGFITNNSQTGNKIQRIHLKSNKGHTYLDLC